LRRVERLAVPITSQVDTNEMTKWLDSEWMRMDHEVDEALILRNKVK
jgi:hypothetical protein